MGTINNPIAYENLSQRVVHSYIRQLSHLPPYVPKNLSPDIQLHMQVSQRELHNFFDAFYQKAFDMPEFFGLPVKQDAYMLPGFSKEEKRNVSKQFKKPRVTMEFGIDFLYLVGQKGELVNGHIHLDKQEYDHFFVTNPRVKQKCLKGLENVGLALSEQNDGIVISHPNFPDMMAALKTLADSCAQYTDSRLGKFIFSRCDFRALDAEYLPSELDMLKTVLSPTELEYTFQLHSTLIEMSYTPVLKVGSVHEWKIQYQGHRKIKSTPFFEFEYDERQQTQLSMHVKCASTNRLVSVLTKQPLSLQKDFFHHAHNCAGASCGWCDTRKALEPSVIEFDGDTRTICWWMQRNFDTVNDEATSMVKQYALLHEALLFA